METNTNNVNETRALLQTIRDKDEPNIAFMQKLQRTSQHGTKDVVKHNRRTRQTKNNSTTDTHPPQEKKRG